MSWHRLECLRYEVGIDLHLDTRCTVQGVAAAEPDYVTLVISGPDGPWDGCPDVYHDENGEPLPMRR